MNLGLQMIEYLISYFTRIPIIWYLVIIAFTLLIAFMLKKLQIYKHLSQMQVFGVVALTMYLLFILVATVFSRQPQVNYQIKIQLFSSYAEAIITGDCILRWEIYFNIVMLFAYGTILPIISKKIDAKVTIVTGCLISIIIELLQLILKRGTFETDDIVHNTLGVAIGYVLYKILKICRKKCSRN